MTDTRARPAQQLAAARERIVAEMDRLQQRIANLQDKVREGMAAVEVARAEEAGLRAALEAIGPAVTKVRRANGAPKTKPSRKLKAATPAPAGVAAMPGNGEEWARTE
jgi:DNA-binding protein H-NS